MESCWSNVELVRDIKESFQVWKVSHRSQFKTKGEIKTHCSKSLHLCIVAGSVTTQ